VPQREIRIVYMGDSITYGQYVDSERRWTAVVDRRLREAHPEAAIATYNRGVSGDTTVRGLLRFPEDVQAVEAVIASVHFGLNDCNCWQTDRGLPRVSPRAFEANLLEMVARLKHFGARHVVTMTSHRTLRRAPLASGEIYEDASTRYSEIIRLVAAEANIELVDVRRAFDAFDDSTLQRLLLPEPDLLHLSEEGHEVYAELVYPFFDQALAHVTREDNG
jgi:lysophospholipase L1-like esterase